MNLIRLEERKRNMIASFNNKPSDAQQRMLAYQFNTACISPGVSYVDNDLLERMKALSRMGMLDRLDTSDLIGLLVEHNKDHQNEKIVNQVNLLMRKIANEHA